MAPAEVVITGAESLVSKIDHVQATLDLTQCPPKYHPFNPTQVLDAGGSGDQWGCQF